MTIHGSRATLRSMAAPSAATVVFFATMTGLAPQAHAASDIEISNYDITYNVTADGGVDVTEQIDAQFNGSNNHGLERFIVTARGYDANQHRVYPMTNVSVSSPTGAPANLSRRTNGSAELLRIGSPNRTVHGPETYVIKYHLASVVNEQKDGTTQFNWNALGGQWKLPIAKATVNLTAPGEVSKVECFQGAYQSSDHCSATKQGKTAQFTATNVGNSKDMTVVAAMPTSAFTSTDKQLEPGANAAPSNPSGDNGDTYNPGDTTSDTQTSPVPDFMRNGIGKAGFVGVVLIPLLTWLGLNRRKRASGSDQRFSEVPPGVIPPNAATAPTSRRGDTPVAVRFEPPQDTTAGMMGVIIDKSADNQDVTGTIVDLAVRGFLKMEQVGEKSLFSKEDWLFTQLPAPHGANLLPYEADLLNGLFADGPTVRLSDLRNTFAGQLAEAKSSMYREAMERQWFTESPASAKGAGVAMATGLGVLALITYFVGGALLIPTTLWALGFAIAAVVVFFVRSGMAARTAVGSAIYDQSKGFEKYLATAEAKQIKFEEAEEIFSRYMPYAVVLGLADRWAKLFAEVAANAQRQGVFISPPMWYIPMGGYNDFSSLSDLGSSLESFSTEAASTFSSTPGSTGDSGFSSGGGGGGGFSGGGGGGGGGGGW